jgi:hypothetical protein
MRRRLAKINRWRRGSEMELLIRQLTWVTRNFVHNLEFVPEDKSFWKPAPGASSAAEISGHTVAMLRSFTRVMEGGELVFDPAAHVHLADRAHAQDQLLLAGEVLPDRMRSLSPAEWERVVPLPWGERTLAEVAVMPVIDFTNHHGQITYIQTILDDAESHLMPF